MDKTILDFWLEVNTVYKAELNDLQLEVYCETLSNYSYLDLREAWKVHMRQSRFCPHPSDLIKILENDIGDLAKSYVAHAYECIRLYGYPNHKDAKEHLDKINPIIFESIGKLFRGWSGFCLQDGEESHHKAQLREFFAAEMRIKNKEKLSAQLIEHSKTERLAGVLREIETVI